MMSRLPPNTPIGRPPPVIFSKRGEIGFYAVFFLCSADTEPVSGDDLVEDKENVMSFRDLADRGEVAVIRENRGRRFPSPVRG